MEQVQGVLSAHAENKILGPERLVYISRDQVYQSALSYFADEKFRKETGYINVCFVTPSAKEDAADLGRHTHIILLCVIQVRYLCSIGLLGRGGGGCLSVMVTRDVPVIWGAFSVFLV